MSRLGKVLAGFVVCCVVGGWEAAAETPSERFDSIFETFCVSLGNTKPSVCAKSDNKFEARLGHRWLILEDYCRSHSSEAPCQSFQTLRQQAPELEPLVLAYDHPSGRWRVRNRLPEDRVEKDVNAKPTVSLDRKEELLVVVEDTNPLLYTLAAGTATEVDIPELAEMKKLAGLLGGNISALVKSLGTQTGDPFSEYQKKLGERLANLREALVHVECALTQITERAGLASHFIQQIELGGSAQYPLVPAPPSGRCQQAGVSSDPQERLRAAFAALSQEKSQALGDEQLCIAFLDAVGSVLSGDPGKPQEIRKGILDARGIERRQACNEDMKAVIDDLGVFLTDTMQLIDGNATQQAQLPGHLKNESLVLLPKVRALSGLSTTYKTLIAGIDPLLQKEADARKAGAQIALFDDRLRDFTIGALTPCTDDANATCVSTAEVARRMVLESETKPVRFDKIQNHSIKLKNNAPLATTVVASRPAEVEAGYALDSVFRDLWGIGASVVYTPLQAPTFSAVSNMATPPQMVIDETGQETRAGQIALLMHYKLGKRLCPQCGGLIKALGVELGSGIETSKPSFFGGLSFQLGKYVRLGAGVTSQQVKELKDQELGDIVAVATDVKTRDTFKEDYYISLSIAFESLRLFSSGD